MTRYTLHTSELFDSKSKTVLQDISITVDESLGEVVDVWKRERPLPESLPEADIDLRGKFVCPGFVDAHTHIFLHTYDEVPSAHQKRDQSFVERVIRATNHCRLGLLAGYTTYRDLGSEGMQEADCNVRDAINRGLIPGPRLFVATKIIASTSAYESRTENHLGGTCLPRGSDPADGPDEIRKAVRRRIGHGADIIKFYADYRRRIMRFPPKQQHPYIGSVLHPPENPNPDLLVYSAEEMNALVTEAKMANAPVAAHAGTKEGTIAAAKAGSTTIEHVYWADAEVLTIMRENGCIFVPTLAVAERLFASRRSELLANTKLAWDMGVEMACGGDTGTFPHGENAREMQLMIEAGMPVEDVLAAGTLGGWKACGGDLCGKRFGWLESGVSADLVALNGNPMVDSSALQNVSFVMKDGKVWKKDGAAIGMI